jgi:hypothetical protein
VCPEGTEFSEFRGVLIATPDAWRLADLEASVESARITRTPLPEEPPRPWTGNVAVR